MNLGEFISSGVPALVSETDLAAAVSRVYMGPKVNNPGQSSSQSQHKYLCAACLELDVLASKT